MGAHAAGQAAKTQAQAAEDAANLQHQDAQASLGFDEQQYKNTLGLMQPYYQTGTQSMGVLADMMGLQPTPGNTSVFQSPLGPNQPALNPGYGGAAGGQQWTVGPAGEMEPIGSVVPYNGDPGNGGNFGDPGNGYAPNPAPAVNGQTTNGQPAATANAPANLHGLLTKTFDQQFVAPDAITEQNDPGYQARLKLGTQALQNSAAAHGDLLGGNTLNALQQYGQDYASNEYQNVYNRALQNYNTNFNVFNANQSNLYNRFANIAGLGQTTAQQLGNVGMGTAGQIGNTLMTSGAQIGQQMNNAAAARASGYVGGANAWGGAMGNLSNLAQMYSIMNKGNNPASPNNYPTPNYSDPFGSGNGTPNYPTPDYSDPFGSGNGTPNYPTPDYSDPFSG
jgi:hypothetical protein